jgi:hypothetical protein
MFKKPERPLSGYKKAYMMVFGQNKISNQNLKKFGNKKSCSGSVLDPDSSLEPNPYFAKSKMPGSGSGSDTRQIYVLLCSLNV